MNVIYYFSGTGNTLFAARKFAEALGNDTKLISISSLNRAEKLDPWDADTVGFFFPVYCFGLPHIYAQFLERVAKWQKTENGHKPYEGCYRKHRKPRSDAAGTGRPVEC